MLIVTTTTPIEHDKILAYRTRAVSLSYWRRNRSAQSSAGTEADELRPAESPSIAADSIPAIGCQAASAASDQAFQETEMYGFILAIRESRL
jgi:hypothetical protein